MIQSSIKSEGFTLGLSGLLIFSYMEFLDEDDKSTAVSQKDACAHSYKLFGALLPPVNYTN